MKSRLTRPTKEFRKRTRSWLSEGPGQFDIIGIHKIVVSINGLGDTYNNRLVNNIDNLLGESPISQLTERYSY